mmetsp:Transcript_100961/g.324109  ORF Transcript_100961/g.324109 Transcript_100961/m.324109 type:complete len:281 (-) Transcript_100961:269-1111(-)
MRLLGLEVLNGQPCLVPLAGHGDDDPLRVDDESKCPSHVLHRVDCLADDHLHTPARSPEVRLWPTVANVAPKRHGNATDTWPTAGPHGHGQPGQPGCVGRMEGRALCEGCRESTPIRRYLHRPHRRRFAGEALQSHWCRARRSVAEQHKTTPRSLHRCARGRPRRCEAAAVVREGPEAQTRGRRVLLAGLHVPMGLHGLPGSEPQDPVLGELQLEVRGRGVGEDEARPQRHHLATGAENIGCVHIVRLQAENEGTTRCFPRQGAPRRRHPECTARQSIGG